MARSRTTKQIAKRIDLNYFKTPNGIRRTNFVLCLVLGAGTLLWLGMKSKGRNHAIYNPGPVSMAHAHFENNCMECHAADGKGGFDRAVSDVACVKCHAAAIHHPNQSGLVMAHEGVQMSGNCASCHVEHRGRENLAGMSDQYCTQCHADLDGHSKQPPEIAKAVTGFNAAEHPEFGRELLVDNQWRDATKVKFNHKFHLEKYKDVASMANCWSCHYTGEPNPHAKLMGDPKTPGHSDVPPWKSEKDRPPAWTVSSDQRYIEPISFERQCAGCHQLELIPGGPVVAHDKLSLVRSQLSGLDQQLLERLANNPDREKLLTKSVTTGTGPRRKTTTTTIDENEWAKGEMDRVRKAAGNWFESDAAKALADHAAVKAGIAQGADAGADLSVMEMYIAHGMSNSCAKCHEMRGSAPTAVKAMAKAMTQPAQKAASAATKPVMMHTLATGIPSTPRRWFEASQFNHDAHRGMTCAQCHKGVEGSTLTSDVLMPKMQDCTSCHHPASTASRGAGSACVTCHVYHDRALEGMPSLLAPATGQAAGAVK